MQQMSPDITQHIDAWGTLIRADLKRNYDKLERLEQLLTNSPGLQSMYIHHMDDDQDSHGNGLQIAVPPTPNHVPHMHHPSPTHHGDTNVPYYQLSRSITTVSEVWKEWKEGIGDGPALEELERKWGTAWRKGDTERRFFNKRRVIINHIQAQIDARHLTEEEAVNELETRRTNFPNPSLDHLRKVLEEERRSRVYDPT